MLRMCSCTYYHVNLLYKSQWSQGDSHAFFGNRRHSRLFMISFVNIRNMFLEFVSKAYSQHNRYQWQAILVDDNAFIVIVRRL